MNFLQRNNNFLIKENSKKNHFLYIIAIIIFILVFSLSWTRNLLFSVGSPLWSIKNGIVYFFSDNIQLLNSKKYLLKDNYILTQKVLANNKEQALFDLLLKENEDLKNILNRSNSSQKLLLGTVLVKPFLSPYDTLIIDVGLNEGVSVGNKILADGNTYIGYVSEVYNDTSKVILYSSPGEKIKVYIGNSNVEKIAEGLGGGNFLVEVPRENDVKEGDSIVMPSISANVFGVVENIKFKETDSYQSVLFKNPVNISELKWVEVLLTIKK